MGTFWQDLRFAARTLRKSWMVTALAVASLALAIGGNGAVFSLIDAFVFRPLPYEAPERVVLVGEREKTQPEFTGNFATSLASYADWAERSRSVGEWGAMQPVTMSLRGPERAEAVQAVRVTRGFFDVMRIGAVRGRLFSAAEDAEGGPGVVLLSHEYWIRSYGEGHEPLGEVLVLDGKPHQVVGVLPEGFEFLTPNQELWVPMARSLAEAARDQRTLIAVGRLRPDATTEAARVEMRGIAEELEAEHPEALSGWTVDTYNLRYDIPNRQSRILFGMLQGAVVLVLVIACVNITNLLLARGQERSGEIALRSVLGAGRWRIVSQLLTESAIMVTAGALLGLGFAALGIRAIAAQFASALPATYEVALDGRVVAFTVAISVLAGLLFGLAPALQTLRRGQAGTLREGSGRSSSGGGKRTVSRVLVVGEIALSFVALGGGSLLVRSFLQIQASDPGFRAERVLTATVRVPSATYPDEEARARLDDELLEVASSLGMVRSAAIASTLPQSPFAVTDSFRVDGAPLDAGAPPPRAVVVRASPAYAEVLEIEVLQGRFFTEADRLDADPVAVVNRTLAEARFEAGRALDGRITVRGVSRRIVGVTEDVQQVLLQTGGAESGESIYVPTAQAPTGARTLIVSTRGDPREAAEPLRSALQVVDRDLVLAQVLTFDEYVEQFLVGVQVFNVVLGGFGLIALLLASLGTYGVLAYSVARRGHEIGIRLALGAEGRQVVRMIAKQGFWLAVTGLAIGGLLTLPLVGLLGSLLEGVSTVQPATLLLIGAVLFGVTMVASLVPAGRAAAVDPMRSLRQD